MKIQRVGWVKPGSCKSERSTNRHRGTVAKAIQFYTEARNHYWFMFNFHTVIRENPRNIHGNEPSSNTQERVLIGR